MALVPFEYNNFIQDSEELLTTQFEDKDVFNRYLRLLKLECQELIGVFQDLIQKRDIDSAQGVNLDNIGDIVGQPRILASVDLYPFFGFIGDLVANSFGTFYNPSIGGYWYSFGGKIGGDVSLSDSQYRQIIKAKIIKNNARGLKEDYIEFGRFVLGTSISFQYPQASPANEVVIVGKRLSMFEKSLMTYVFAGLDYDFTYTPKPLGVGLDVIEGDLVGTLGFVGTLNAKGMISLSFPFDGGIFADAYF